MKRWAMTTLLDEALEAWGFARDGVIDEIENLARPATWRSGPAPEAGPWPELVRAHPRVRAR